MIRHFFSPIRAVFRKVRLGETSSRLPCWHRVVKWPNVQHGTENLKKKLTGAVLHLIPVNLCGQFMKFAFSRQARISILLHTDYSKQKIKLNWSVWTFSHRLCFVRSTCSFVSDWSSLGTRKLFCDHHLRCLNGRIWAKAINGMQI